MQPTIIQIPTGRERRVSRYLLSIMAVPKVIIALMLAMSFAADAGDPQTLEIPWYSIDGGGGTSEGGQFSVAGTIGQHDAGAMTGGGFSLAGGFWADSTPVQLPGDCEHDGDVDLDDYTCFFDCVLGPGQGLLPDCEPFDLDNDGDVDIADYSIFEILFN